MKNETSKFIDKITNEQWNQIRGSLSDAEARRILKITYQNQRDEQAMDIAYNILHPKDET